MTNPQGWNEPGMQPITWSDPVAEAAVDRHYQITFERWQRHQTRPETRWEFAERMMEQEDKR